MNMERKFLKPFDMVLILMLFVFFSLIINMRSLLVPLLVALAIIFLYVLRLTLQERNFKKMSETERQMYLENRSPFEYRPRNKT